MPRFFVTPSAFAAETVELTGEACRHIGLSLRMAVGDTLTLCDGEGNEGEAILLDISPDRVVARLQERHAGQGELPLSVHLYQGNPKGDKLDLIVQKAVELGASSLTPFESSRCVARIKPERAEKQTARLSRIASEAAGQCGRARLMSVGAPLSFTAALHEAVARGGPILFCYEGEKTRTLKDALLAVKASGAKTLSLFVGSEGGFSPEEAEEAMAASALSLTFGARILRCETAPLYALSCLSFFFSC